MEKRYTRHKCGKCGIKHIVRIDKLTLWVDLIISHDNRDSKLPNEDIFIK